MIKRIYFILFISLFLNSVQAEEPLIFNEETDSVWLPTKYILNGGFDVLQNPYWFNQKDYKGKSEIVWKRIRSPHSNVVADGGYDKLFVDEFLSTRVLPNIGLHLIGGAHDTLWLTEYYEYYGYSYPKLMALLTTYAAHFGNEVLEATEPQISSHDHIADMYFFDVLAFFLAENHHYMRVLREDLGMRAWHLSPMYNPETDDFYNAGLNYIFRPEVFHMNDGTIQPFYFLGMQTMLGSSFKYKEGNLFSLAMGLSPTDPLIPKSRFVTGLFHEREGQLEAALFINGSEDYRYRLNLFTPFFARFFGKGKMPLLPMDLMVGQSKSRDYSVGVNINLPFGIGSNTL